jgi:hypothetical protein
MFFEGLRSERLLMRHAADRLSVRWYAGYDLGGPLPDHSSLTRIRERYSVVIFRRFFEKIVEQCQQVGLVWGRELYIDARHPWRPMPPLTQSNLAFLSKRISPICSLPKQRKGEQRQCRR